MAAAVALTFLYVAYGRLVDERLHGERERTLPRVYARAVELRRGQLLSEDDLIARLNDLGYAHRPTVDGPGAFAVSGRVVTIEPRSGTLSGRAVRVTFPPAPAARRAGGLRSQSGWARTTTRSPRA